MGNLEILDYFIISIIIIVVLISIWKGFIQSVLGLLTWIGSIIITLNFFNSLSNYISFQLNKIDFFNNWDQLSQVIGIVISIPSIFIISLIVLRKIRKIISTDIDKATIGIILDKFFGIIYGLVFAYFVFSILLLLTEQINLNFMFFIMENSFLLESISLINETYILNNIPYYSEYNEL